MRISRIETSAPVRGIERLRVFFRGHAFTPHRHDRYALGITSTGIQLFDYRGAVRRCLPGQVFVLHPDERHDGRPGTAHGYGYRSAYIDPSLIAAATEASTLPFLADPVSLDARLRTAIDAIVGNGAPDDDDEITTVDDLTALADALVLAAGGATKARRIDRRAMQRVRERLQAGPDAKLTASELEAATGLSRWQLARQFRAASGVSMHRFHLLRRLDRARALLQRGGNLADIAQATGFADQAHMTRQFRAAYGLSPGEWRRLTGCRPGS